MKRVHTLSFEELEALNNGYKNGEKHHFRIRCKIILSSHEGASVPQIARDFKKDKDTIYSLLKKYENLGIQGLHNAKGQGRKATLANLTQAQAKELKEAVDNQPQNLREVCKTLSLKFDFNITKWMLINYIKKN